MPGLHNIIFNSLSTRLSFLLLIIILVCPTQKSKAQQLPLYSQYSFNAFLLNPAVAGSEGYTSVNLTSREQWFGVEGAPRTYAISLQTRIMKRSFIEKNTPIKKKLRHNLRSGRVGLGIYIFNDRAGQIDQTGAQFTYAYHINTKKSQLSLGVTFSLLQFMINKNALELNDQIDDQITNNRLLIYVPDANIGAYYSDENKYFGLSVLQLSHASINISNYDNKFLIYRHFYLTSGFKYEIDEQNIVEPSLLIKSSEQFHVQMDLTLKYIYARRLWVGFGFRTGSTFIGSLGVNVNRLYAGYAYDYCSKGLLNNSYGSHELMIALKLGDNVRRYKWIERY